MGQVSLAVFPGSFDPLTNGHTNIIRRGLRIFDRLIVAVLDHPEKRCLFTVKERMNLIAEVFKSEGDRVKADSFSGLLVDFTKKVGTKVIIRGLRATSDYEYEAQMALMNQHLSPEIETFFLMTEERSSYISSSLVKQVGMLGGDVSAIVPAAVNSALQEKFKARKGA